LSRLLAAALLACAAGLARAEAPLVAAASDLRYAIEEIARVFERETGTRLRLSFGSSGNFRHQIAAGAPYQLFLSADEEYVFALHREGRAEDEGVLYALGRIVLFAPRGAPYSPDEELKGLAEAVRAGRIRRFAIANPEHAPYGRAAREALQGAGLWAALKPRLVLGENVSQAAQFAANPSTQGGIIAYSLALSPELGRLGTHVVLPEAMHAPLRQRMALMRGAGATSRAFYRYLQQPQARAILGRHGFVLPQTG
jgi:molybdate transport system substrate-binding protein